MNNKKEASRIGRESILIFHHNPRDKGSHSVCMTSQIITNASNEGKGERGHSITDRSLPLQYFCYSRFTTTFYRDEHLM